MKRCVIFGAVPLNYSDYVDVKENDYVICADAGIRNAALLKITPDLIVGDFDSCSKLEAEGTCTITFPARKDDTDLMLAVKYGIEAGCDEFVIYGALGGKRLDHTVAAFSVLGYLADNKIKAELRDERSIVRILDVGEHLVENKGGYLSLFPFGCDRVNVYISGTEYDGEVLLMSSFPIGVSNEIVKDFAKITVFQGDLESRVLMILADKD